MLLFVNNRSNQPLTSNMKDLC